MMRILFVGDGKRDAVMVPRLVERILGATVHETTKPWARLHGAGKGYSRKLTFAFRQTQSGKMQGLVATVDQDRETSGRRLKALEKAREDEREKGSTLPVALGEAVPHGEAWLLDDAVAVREGLVLGSDQAIPSVTRSKNPKAALEKLYRESDRRNEPIDEVFRDISKAVDPSRCQHAKSTGFVAFTKDVRAELGLLAKAASRRM